MMKHFNVLLSAAVKFLLNHHSSYKKNETLSSYERKHKWNDFKVIRINQQQVKGVNKSESHDRLHHTSFYYRVWSMAYVKPAF